MASGQRMNGQESGGQKIDDHSFWAGGKDKNSILPQGVKFKDQSSTKGGGSLSKYQDTSEAIKSQQENSVGKIKSNGNKPGQR